MKSNPTPKRIFSRIGKDRRFRTIIMYTIGDFLHTHSVWRARKAAKSFYQKLKGRE